MSRTNERDERDERTTLRDALRSIVRMDCLISCHQLSIETGRYNRPQKIPLEARLCPFCKDRQLVEDEKHFLLDCTLYKDLNEFKDFIPFCKRKFPLFSHMTSDSIFSLIMSSTDIQFLSVTATFINPRACAGGLL